jgi:hypothetical protein
MYSTVLFKSQVLSLKAEGGKYLSPASLKPASSAKAALAASAGSAYQPSILFTPCIWPGQRYALKRDVEEKAT